MKKAIYIISLFIVAPVFLTSCEDININKKPQETNNRVVKNDIIANTNKFGIGLFKQININNGNSNTLVSPVSVAIALSMAYNGADGETAWEFNQVLCMEGKSLNEVNQTLQQLISQLSSEEQTAILNIANSVWYKQGFQIIPEFLDANKNYYQAEVEAFDSSLPTAVDTINQWVSDNTNELIPEIIEKIDPLDVLFLINAIYFKSEWETKFNKENTHEASFLTPDNIELVPMMSTAFKGINVLDTNNLKAFELPYKGNKFSFFVFIPESIDDFIQDLNGDKWHNLLNSLSPCENVIIKMPQLKYKCKYSLYSELKDMGLIQAFSPAADFSNINSSVALYISDVIHKTYIEVNEEGTEAAAVTIIDLKTSMPPYTIKADKPFLFSIVDNETQSIIIMGKVVNPSN